MNSERPSFVIDCVSINESIVDGLIQDTGVGSNDEEYDKLKTRIFKAPDERKYKDLWRLAKMYVELLKKSKERFPRYPSQRTDSSTTKQISAFIFDLRVFVDNKFVLNEEPLHTKFTSLWGEDNESGGPTLSDKARIFGILTSENYRDELNIVMGKPSVASATAGNRIDRDDPSLYQRNIWLRVKMDFHDPTIVISHPPNWDQASAIDGYSDIRPNDPQRLIRHQGRDADFFKKTLFKEVLSVYRCAAKKYRKDTGNGAGQPENFMDWNENEDVKFQYFCHGQAVALLTWIFMKDRENHYILEEEQDAIPEHIQVEEDAQSTASSSTMRRSPTSLGKSIEDVLKSTQSTMSCLLKYVSSANEEARDSNMNYHDMAKTLELTNQMQKDLETESERDSRDSATERNDRRKRLKAALEKIEDGIIDSLGC